jgi:hypothetical protein
VTNRDKFIKWLGSVKNYRGKDVIKVETIKGYYNSKNLFDYRRPDEVIYVTITVKRPDYDKRFKILEEVIWSERISSIGNKYFGLNLGVLDLVVCFTK